MKRSDSKKFPGCGDLVMAKEYVQTGVDSGPQRSGPRGEYKMRGHSSVHEIPIGFLKIEYVKEVEQLIRKVLLDPAVSALLGAALPAAEAGAAGAVAGAGQAAAKSEPVNVPSEEVPDYLRQAIEAEFKPGEQLVWIGQPMKRVMFWRTSLAFLAVIGLAVAIVMMWLTMKKDFALFALPLALIPAGVPFYFAWVAGRTCYAVTNKRAFIVKKTLGLKKNSYQPSDLTGMKRSDGWIGKDEGVGDLVFKEDVTITTTTYKAVGGRGGTRNLGSSQSLSVSKYGFLAVRRARDLEKLMRATLIERFLDKLYAGQQ
jgi:hypothetical protein